MRDRCTRRRIRHAGSCGCDRVESKKERDMNPTSSTTARALAFASLLLAVAAAPAFAKLDVEIWTDRGDDAVYQPGDAMHLKVRTSADAYLLVYELDTQGNVNLLYPLKRGTGYIQGKDTFKLPEDVTQDELVVEKETGQGFLVAISSMEPFKDLPWYLRPFDPQPRAWATPTIRRRRSRTRKASTRTVAPWATRTW